MSTIQGYTGPTGPDGLMGLKGDPGAIGPTGGQGPRGEQGRDGPAGQRGPTGERGEQGPRGEQGRDGPAGQIGPTGERGEQGPRGEQGRDGPAGQIGPTGERGIQGPRGEQGPAGQIGPTGERGERGPQGIPGTAANTGPTGPAANIINSIELSTYSGLLDDGALNIQMATNSINFFHNNIPVKNFSPLKYGLNGTVNTISYYESPYFENLLYIGGNFKRSNITNEPLNYIALWDGNNLLPLGSGLNDSCYTTAVDSIGNLYAGGSFTSAGGVSLNGLASIAKWDGVNWNSLQNTLPIICNSISFDNHNNMYAFGDTPGYSNTITGMYKWDGITLSSIGRLITGPADQGIEANGIGYASYFNRDTNTIIVGGNFNRVFGPNNNISANAIASLNLDTMIWSPFGNGLRNSKGPSICSQIQVDDLGNIYASGNFDTIDGWSSVIPGFAKWNGSEWSAVFTTI